MSERKSPELAFVGADANVHLLLHCAAAEQGMAPMDALLAATRNVAEACGKGDEIGTIGPGKRADLLVLDGNPLDDPESYGRIAHVVEDGRLIERDRLPVAPVLTRPEERAAR
jgi:imidazolonepropionase-like amidohydrolase